MLNQSFSTVSNLNQICWRLFFNIVTFEECEFQRCFKFIMFYCFILKRLCSAEPSETRQGSSSGNVRTQTPIREKGQRSTSVSSAGKSLCHLLNLNVLNQCHTVAWPFSSSTSDAAVFSPFCRFFLPAVKDPSPEELLRQLQEERTCKVCMDKLVSIVFIPCGHLVVCGDCAASLRHCPICRAVIRGSVRAFMSWGWHEKPQLYRCCMSGLELFFSLSLCSFSHVLTQNEHDCRFAFYISFSIINMWSCSSTCMVIAYYTNSTRDNRIIKRAHSFINKHLFTWTQSTVLDK